MTGSDDLLFLQIESALQGRQGLVTYLAPAPHPDGFGTLQAQQLLAGLGIAGRRDDRAVDQFGEVFVVGVRSEDAVRAAGALLQIAAQPLFHIGR